MLTYQIIITLGVGGLLVHLLINLFVFRRPQRTGCLTSRVSVLVPARNEEACIASCLESLVAQRAEVYEILVLDDHSEDQTEKLIESFSQRDSKVRKISGQALPEGWTGKAWACQQLSQSATGDVLVFTDADTVHHPDAIGSAVSCLESKNADMISLWPYQQMQTLGEKLVVPFVHLLLLVFLPHWMPGKWRSLGAANGQFIAFSKAAYDRLGGHESVKYHLVEDVSLARLAKVAGMKMINMDGSQLVSCRMYESFPQIWEGFSKNLRAGCDGSVMAFMMLQLIQLVFLFLPFLWLIAGLVTGAEWLPWVLVQVVLIYKLRLALLVRVKHSWTSVLLHPLGQFVELAIAMNSWIKFSNQQISWKGRTYSGK